MESKAQHYDGGTFFRDSLEVKDGCERVACKCAPLRPQWVELAGWRNGMANPVMHDAGVPILRAFEHSVHLWADHNGIDCTHFCLNGPQMRHDLCELWAHAAAAVSRSA